MNERKPTPDEVALAEAVATQASLALESAWLYTETQRRAMRDQLTTQVASQLRGSLDIDTILQTAVREIGQLLELAEVEVRVGADLVSPEFSQEREQ
jgi:GAF domain-containing protein